MPNALQSFTFGLSVVRAISIDGEPWFVAKDVATALGYSTSTLAQSSNLFKAVPSEWTVHNRIMVRSANGMERMKNVLCISEQGLYFFLGRSDKPKALPFQKWITKEVLPAFRKTGFYSTKQDEPVKKLNLNLVEIVNNEPRVSSLVIAENCDLTHHNLLQNIDKYKVELESLGRVAFQMRPFETNGGIQQRRIALLNEQQAAFLITLSCNTEQVVAFKLALTKAFFEARKQLKKEKQNERQKLSLTEFMKASEIVLEAAGIRNNQLALALDRIVINRTGESILQLSGTQLKAPQQKQLATPSEIGRPLGLSARSVNRLLAEKGLQRRTAEGWRPTQKGVEAGGVLLNTGKSRNSGTPFTQLKWPDDILQ